ncbi:MAG: hypothetical protein P8P74_17545 [Crocinitomicaceae bacterium]|nr:hypothetical protein [Crocinitomicaceae bacterium]
MRILLTFFVLIPILSSAQLTEERFEAVFSAHTWHPTERGLLLFNGVHTVTIRKGEGENENMYVRLAGIDSDSGEKFHIEGTGIIRFENDFFEVQLDDSFSNIAAYVAGTLISDDRMKLCSSASAFTLTEEGMKDVKWYPSRY